MRQEIRKIQVLPDTKVTSVWAVPDNYPRQSDGAIILAHGAGNDMNHPFMTHFHLAFAEAGLLSVKFNFPYKELGRKAPDRMPLLESAWRAVIRAVKEDPEWAPKALYLAGKSMGGRVASYLAAQGEACNGLIFLGYPLHPAKQPGKLRVDHWDKLFTPTLFVQGTRDSLCELEVLKAELPRIPAPVALNEIEGGDHSFKVPKSQGKTQETIWQEVALKIDEWIKKTRGV